MPAYNRSKMSYHYGAHVTPDQARRVWAHLTEQPRTSMAEIAQAMRVSKSIVRAARELLRDAGYVDYEDGKPRTTTILVPFRVMRKQRSVVRSQQTKAPAVRAGAETEPAVAGGENQRCTRRAPW
jgi:hypothetical protein